MKIDPDTTDAFLATQAAELLWQAWCHQFDADVLRWCAAITVATDKGDGTVALDHAEKADGLHQAATEAAAVYEARIESDKTRDSLPLAILQRAAVTLPVFIANTRQAYSEHGALADIAERDGDTETWDTHRSAMLHAQGTVELAGAAAKQLD